jgi:hypothetical protein
MKEIDCEQPPGYPNRRNRMVVVRLTKEADDPWKPSVIASGRSGVETIVCTVGSLQVAEGGGSSDTSVLFSSCSSSP